MSQELRRERKLPWYFLTLLTFFIAPVIFLLKKIKTLDQTAFLKSLAVIIVIGYGWSMVVSGNHWWSFNPATMLGIEVLPYLPLEEFLFYPLGGALSILIYVLFKERMPDWKMHASWILLYICFFSSITLGLIYLAIAYWGQHPAYLISQIIVYNGFSLILWFWAGQKIALQPVGMTIGMMTVIGFFWDWLAFSHGWWVYHAVLGWYWPANVPIDDWNFYLFAPLAAIALYEILRSKQAVL